MKILILSHEYPPIGGGGANACMYLSRQYTELGHHVTIISAWYEGLKEEEVDEGVHIFRVRSQRKHKECCSFMEMVSYLFKAWPAVVQLEEAHHFDICQVFFGIPSGPLGYLLKKRYKVPYIIRFGGGDIPGFQKRFTVIYKIIGPFLKIIWQNANALIANSDGLKKLAMDFYSKNEITIIHNGVDTNKFYPLSDAKSISDSQNINILFVSRLIERKGLQFIIPLLSYIQEKSKKRIQLTVVGDGPYREELVKLTKQNSCEDFVCFEGQKDKNELLSYYQTADIFILPSKKEGMPNVVLEAMACGLPIIMSPCEGSEELITNNGIVSTIDAFADNLVKLCEDKELRYRMGQNSVCNVENNFRWEGIAQKYIEVLKDSCGE